MSDPSAERSTAPAGPPLAGAARAALDRVFRRDRGSILANLIRLTGEFEHAEDALQDAVSEALDRWPHSGVPRQPAAWLHTAARRRAIDRIRRSERFREKAAVLSRLEGAQGAAEGLPDDAVVADDRLRLIFTCCHPALPIEARIALTLKTIVGLTTQEIARAFLIEEPALAQRIVRAKRKITSAGIPYRVPEPADLPERLAAVLQVIYLIFTEGHFSSGDAELVRSELSDEALRLGASLVELLPGEPEARGLLALLLLADARRHARLDEAGRLVLLERQDRSRWDRGKIAHGLLELERALGERRPGPFQIQAAIAAVHAVAPRADATDWAEILALYDQLTIVAPTPVVALNRAVAVAMSDGPEAGLRLLDDLGREPGLRTYGPYQVARADLLRRAGREVEALAAYEAAVEMATNPAERAYLQSWVDALGDGARGRREAAV
ncbi:MAG: DUF6596 domain-containing protein [Gemmatimonadota bacterium]